MIKVFDLISGSVEEVKEYIENLKTFDSWQFGKDYYSQVKRLLNRPGLMSHIGAVTYQDKNSDGFVTIHAAFVAIVNPNPFLDD